MSSLKDTKILVVDDHHNIRVTLKLILSQEGAIVDEATNCHEARTKLGIDSGKKKLINYDLILLDIRMPDGNGLDILKALSECQWASHVIMISGEGTTQEAFQATELGAFDYIEKPFSPERILVTVRRCLDFNKLQSQIEQGYELLGEHESMDVVRSLIAKVAPAQGRVLIIGETGTGKELVARAIHRQSRRARQPLVKVNCAAIPHSLIESELFGHVKGSFTGALKDRRGLFEQADGGTLFLDEIGELDLAVQAKLLRVLETGELVRVGSEKTIKVDVRIVAATHRDLKEMVEAKEFREDLYYRLNVVTIHLPPLRERQQDIEYLARYFLRKACDEHSLGQKNFTAHAVAQLKSYSWPGNVRELKNIIERTAILTTDEEINVIEGLDLDCKTKTPSTTKEPKAQKNAHNKVENIDVDQPLFQCELSLLSWHEFHRVIDAAYLEYVLNHTQGNVSEASRLLNLERAYLHRLLKKLGVRK